MANPTNTNNSHKDKARMRKCMALAQVLWSAGWQPGHMIGEPDWEAAVQVVNHDIQTLRNDAKEHGLPYEDMKFIYDPSRESKEEVIKLLGQLAEAQKGRDFVLKQLEQAGFHATHGTKQT